MGIDYVTEIVVSIETFCRIIDHKVRRVVLGDVRWMDFDEISNCLP